MVAEQPMVKVWRAALYIRLSVEFNGKRGDFLETQRQIMEDHLAMCPDVEITGTYIDNGVSGSKDIDIQFKFMGEFGQIGG